ncbi:hypothetical protein GOP47_0029760 [Adiantum capillus-veneris]|nr:hypothetical protein GOP47_0029760 [Adiantum capillus-veneris]
MARLLAIAGMELRNGNLAERAQLLVGGDGCFLGGSWAMQAVAMAPYSNLLAVLLHVAVVQLGAAVNEAGWSTAQATVYGDNSGTINSGACGYVLYDSGYGSNTAAVSPTLFNSGKGCGSCFEIKCDTSVAGAQKKCAAGKSVVVTATNLCPPNAEHPNAWCNPPNRHFDMTTSAFSEIAHYSSGTPMPVLYRSVPCTREGGMKFTINGNSRYNLVLLTNVGGAGVVKSVRVKGANTGWMALTRSWGSNWQTPEDMRGQTLSFQVVLADGTTATSYNVAPSSWQLGQTFVGSQFP